MKSKFRKAPGLLYDWISMFTLKLNEREKWVQYVVRAGNEAEDLAYISYWLQRFPEPDEILKLFFYLPDRMTQSCLMRVFSAAMRQTEGRMEAAQLWETIGDVSKMKEAVAQYYLKYSVQGLKLEEIGEIIRHSKLAGEIQFLLLEFFLNPSIFVASLQRWGKEYYEEMESVYREAANSILKWQESVGEEELRACFFYMHNEKKRAHQKLLAGLDRLVYSVTVIMKNTLLIDIGSRQGAAGWALLGTQYDQMIKRHKENKLIMDQLGNAAGDRNRTAIIEYIVAEGEKTSADIAKKLGMAPNTAAYHLEVMRKARLLNSHNKGKSTYFWINPDACLMAANVFQRWARGKAED